MLSNKYYLAFIFIFFVSISVAQKPLSLKEAVNIAVTNYGTVKAKNNYAQASQASALQAKRDYLPNFNIAAQQDFGTINGQNGPLYGFGGLATGSSGLPLPKQNWNAAFGALYLTNVNWEFFAFGRAKEKIKTAEAAAFRDVKDLEQEIFRHKIKVAGAYLNLLAAQQLTRSYRKNLERADNFRQIVTTRALNGLIAGVDSSLANAEYSNAKIALTRALDVEQEQSNQLAQLLGINPEEFVLDSFFVSRIPANTQAADTNRDAHPVLQWFKSRIQLSDEQGKYYKTFYYPAFTLVGILQTRASGFGNNYASDQHDFTKNYWDGINPNRVNYLFGIGVTWNLTQPLRISQQVKAQKFISEGLQNEYDLASQQINAQLQLAEVKIRNAMANYLEAPVQVEAASQAYLQKSVLYKNGLTDLVDVTQASYILIRAETDRDIANNNVWQALLLKAAAAGDFSLFESQF
jgi:outer membrane protein TolC